jgi:hypothetical protein
MRMLNWPEEQEPLPRKKELVEQLQDPTRE